MSLQKKDLGNAALTVRLALCKIGITTCLAIILSIFLFACGSSRDSGNTTDTSSIIRHEDRSSIDTTTSDSSSMRSDSIRNNQ
jgi:hypothetical protein